MEKFTHAAVSPPNHGTPAMAFGKHVIRMMAANTGGSFGMFEAIVPRGRDPMLRARPKCLRHPEPAKAGIRRSAKALGSLRKRLPARGRVRRLDTRS